MHFPNTAGATPRIPRPSSAVPLLINNGMPGASSSKRNNTKRETSRGDNAPESSRTTGRSDGVITSRTKQYVRNVTNEKLLECWRKCELKATGGMPSFYMYRQSLVQAGIPLPEKASFKIFKDLQQGWGDQSNNWVPVEISEKGIDQAMRTISPMLLQGSTGLAQQSTRSTVSSVKSLVPKLKLTERSRGPLTAKASTSRSTVRTLARGH